MISSKWILLIGLVAISYSSSAQDLDAKSPKQDKQGTRQQQKAEKKKEKNKAQIEKSTEQNIKHSQQLQSKEVRKRMKKSRKKADAFNNPRGGSFFKKLFKKKQ